MGSETVLVVENDKSVQSLIGNVLRRRGYNLLVAQDGADALRVAEEHHAAIHLLITSAAASTTGAEVATAMRARRPDTRVLYLQKPFTPVGLVKKVALRSNCVRLQRKEDTSGYKGRRGLPAARVHLEVRIPLERSLIGTNARRSPSARRSSAPRSVARAASRA